MVKAMRRTSSVLGAACLLWASVAWGAVEPNANRPGSDFDNFDAASAQQCEARCGAAAQCKAWTWKRPSRTETPASKSNRLERHTLAKSGRCYLKNAMPAKVDDPCCDSGIKASALGTTVHRATPPGTPKPPAANAAGTGNQLLLRKPAAIASDGADRQMLRQAPASSVPPAVANPPRLHALPRPGVSPAQLNFATVWGGDVVARTVEVAPPAMALEGMVRVELGPHKVFRISEVKVLGPIGSGTRVQVDNRGVPPGGRGRIAVDRTRLVVPGGPQVDVPLHRGETLAVTVQSAPVMEQLRNGPFNGAGPQDAQLKVTGQGWRASIPISAVVGGEGFVATVRPTNSRFCAPTAYDSRFLNRYTLTVALQNRHSHGVDGTLQLVMLPPGLVRDDSAATVKYHLGPKASAQLELPYSIIWSDFRFPQDANGSLPAVKRAAVKVVQGSESFELPVEITVLPGSKSYDMSGEDGLEWQAHVFIYCDGQTSMSSSVFNPNLVVGRGYELRAMWRGRRIVATDGDVGPSKTQQRSFALKDWHSRYVIDNYEQMLREPPTVKLFYSNHGP